MPEEAQGRGRAPRPGLGGGRGSYRAADPVHPATRLLECRPGSRCDSGHEWAGRHVAAHPGHCLDMGEASHDSHVRVAIAIRVGGSEGYFALVRQTDESSAVEIGFMATSCTLLWKLAEFRHCRAGIARQWNKSASPLRAVWTRLRSSPGTPSLPLTPSPGPSRGVADLCAPPQSPGTTALPVASS
jgi:hypothetical protein